MSNSLPVVQRDKNIDFLRIVSMWMIIGFHCVYHGNAGMDAESYLVRFSAEVFYHLGELGTSCFFLISGYYIERTVFKPVKLIMMFLQMEFYIVLGKIILTLFGNNTTAWTIIDFFPVFQSGYWFFHVYILIYLLQPFLKKLVTALDQRLLLRLIVTQLFIWSFIPTLVYSLALPGSTESMPYYNRYIWFLNVYIIGAYLRRYEIPIPKHDILHIAEAKRWMILVLPFELLILFIIMGERGLWPFSPVFFWTPNSLLMVFMSISLFVAFRDWKPKQLGKWCSIMASTTLGIYLLHDGELRLFLWRELFHCNADISLTKYWGWLISVTAFVFFGGMIIDLARQALEKRTFIPLVKIIQCKYTKGRQA